MGDLNFQTSLGYATVCISTMYKKVMSKKKDQLWFVDVPSIPMSQCVPFYELYKLKIFLFFVHHIFEASIFNLWIDE